MRQWVLEDNMDTIVFEDDLSNGQVMRFYFEDLTPYVEPDMALASYIYNVGVLVSDAEEADMNDALLDYGNDEPIITGRDPFVSAIHGIRMYKQCVEALREMRPGFRTGFACGWLDDDRHRAYKSFLGRKGYVEQIVDGDPCLFKMYDALDKIKYNVIKYKEKKLMEKEED
jgi:hypothetical protein